MAAWENAPIVKDGAPSVTPAWMQAPLANAPAAPTAKPRGSELAEATLGPSEILGAGILNLPAAAAHGALDLYHKIFGAPTPQADKVADAISVKPGQAGQQLEGDIGNLGRGLGQSLDAAAGGIPSQAIAAGQTALQNHPVVNDVLHNTADVAGDVASMVPVGEGARALVGAGADAVNAARAAEPVFRSSADAPHAATWLAGNSGRQALILRNQQLANVKLAGEAGVTPGEPLSYESMEAARAAPNSVYDRVAHDVPTGPLSPRATEMIQNAGSTSGTVVTGGPDVQANIQSIRDQLLAGPRTGQQVVLDMRKLRQEGYANISSDDVSNQQLGRAQVDMANALEQHVADTIPTGASTDLNQLQLARTALAKNFAVQSAMRGSNVDLQAIGRIQRADPDLLTGVLKEAADFANEHPEVSTRPNPTTAYKGGPSVVEDVKNLNLIHPIRSLVEMLGGAAGRRLLTGDTAGAVQAARDAIPPNRSSVLFGPRSPGELPLEQPLGTAFEPNQGDMFGSNPTPLPGPTPPAPAPVGLNVGEGKASPTRNPTPSGPSNYSTLANAVAPPPPELPAGVRVGEGKASPTRNPTPSGPSNYSTLANAVAPPPPELPAGVRVGEGKASPTRNPTPSGPSNYSTLANAVAPAAEGIPDALRVGEGKASPGPSTPSGPSNYGTLADDLLQPGLSVGEGKASPVKSTAKSKPSTYAKQLTDDLKDALGSLLGGK